MDGAGRHREVIEPVERYLAYLAAIERSPNTVRAYAISLKLWFEFLAAAGLAWDQVGIEDVARFVAWLRAPAPNVVVLAEGAGSRRPASINRYLAGVFGFYDHHARTGVSVACELVAWRRVSRGSYKPFLHHVTKGRPIPVRPVKLHVPRRPPATLEPEQIVAILAACENLRDRFLFSLLAETGMRVGQALGLRHSDFVSRKQGGPYRAPGRQRQRRPGQVPLRSRSSRCRRRWCASTRSTCTSNTARSTRTTCS